MAWIAAGGVCIFMIIMMYFCAVKLRDKICEYNQKRENTHTDRKRERENAGDRERSIYRKKVNKRQNSE